MRQMLLLFDFGHISLMSDLARFIIIVYIIDHPRLSLSPIDNGLYQRKRKKNYRKSYSNPHYVRLILIALTCCLLGGESN